MIGKNSRGYAVADFPLTDERKAKLSRSEVEPIPASMDERPCSPPRVWFIVIFAPPVAAIFDRSKGKRGPALSGCLPPGVGFVTPGAAGVSVKQRAD